MSLSRISRTWLRLVGIGPLVLLAALLPSYLSIDHWSAYAGFVTGGHDEAEEGSAEHTSHGMHCHYGPSACSDQPAPINGRVLPAAVELVEPHLAAVEMDISREVALSSVVFAPPTDPPRALLG
jgi:hypothetical protein